MLALKSSLCDFEQVIRTSHSCQPLLVRMNLFERQSLRFSNKTLEHPPVTTNDISGSIDPPLQPLQPIERSISSSSSSSIITPHPTACLPKLPHALLEQPRGEERRSRAKQPKRRRSQELFQQQQMLHPPGLQAGPPVPLLPGLLAERLWLHLWLMTALPGRRI